MPRLSFRQARTRRILQVYLAHRRVRIKRQIRLKNKFARMLRLAGLTDEKMEPPLLDPVQLYLSAALEVSDSSAGSSAVDSDSDISDGSDSSTSTDNWSDVLGSDWRGSGQASESSESSLFDSSSSDHKESDDEMPDLHPLGYPDSDDEDDSTSVSSTSSQSDSGRDGDDEEGWGLEDGLGGGEDVEMRRPENLLRWVRHNLEEMHAQRYEMPRDTFPRGPAFMRHVLGQMKDTRADLFREELRISPYTFDMLVAALSDDPIFTNNSNNAQMPIEDQLAIALYRFGHSGNAAGLQKIANWAGVAKGTVTLATRRVMTAILRRDFMAEAVRMPTDPEKEKAKAWVEAHSCKAWRNGWCLVDGTLVPLFDRPYWFGESYFDRKCNYSNTQVISLPNLRIIDFGYGFTGSTHDSTAWEETRMVKEREIWMKEGEFIWADSAYPVCGMSLQKARTGSSPQ